MRPHLFAVLLLIAAAVGLPAKAQELSVGVAAADVTPDYPVRLSGFGFRRAESEGVTQKIWAKALAIGGGEGGPAVLITVDNLGIPISMTRDVGQRLAQKAKLDPSRLAITASHTHTAPMLTGVVPTLFGVPIPPEHQAHIDRYTKELTDALEKVALAAITDMKPARVEFGIGTSDLAANRRTRGGPVDHDLPVLVVRDKGGKPRAVYVSYACHCVTLSNNKVSGDWAGFVQETVQKNYPGAVCLTSVGCGADSNPSSGVTGDKVDVAAAQGRKIAAEVDRLLKQQLAPVTRPVATKAGEVELMFDTLPTRQQWEEKAKRQDAVGHHARVQLAKLDRGEQLQTKIAYPIMTWTFGDQLAMVFLPGEVVVDYSLRLKKDFDRSRLWVNAYSNDAPCYIPSERVLKEGGYEGGDAMVYYDRPTKFAAGLEQKIVDEVHRQLPQSFLAPKGTEGTVPKSPEQSRQSIRVPDGIEVELVASEPLVTSPVAIDWSADGRLWVCEMLDYPMGADNQWQPGGRIKFLQDTDGDGKYDKATVFLDRIPFPTGVTAWGRGVFVCAAPDILYAEDTDGDGMADKVDKVFSGFFTDNFQARVICIALGLDNWLYGANGLLGGVITDRAGHKLDIRGHDFRFRPPGSSLELVTGLTQQGRVRDDWGRWFGCDNSNALFYYPYEQRYLARNPGAPSPPTVVRPAADYDAGRVYPASRLLERFNDPEAANRVTSACGLGIYRDTLLGEGYFGNAFVCEPVHNLVQRMVLLGDHPSLVRRRTGRETEFFASTDNWSRPVQARTGPDGALWVVDMYRFLIEHPRWIPANRLAQIDVRAGADAGRIYRLRPAGKALRAVRDLTKLGGAELAAALDSPNGTERDRVHAELLSRHDVAAIPALEKLAAEATLPQVRVQALCALDGLGSLPPAQLERALKDPDPWVRRHAVRLCEAILRGPKGPVAAGVGAALRAAADDSDRRVAWQVAFTLGEWDDPAAGELLASLAGKYPDDAEMRTAVLSSASRHVAPILAAVMRAKRAADRSEWVRPLVAMAAGSNDPALLERAVAAVTPPPGTEPGPELFVATAALADAMRRKGVDVVEKVPGVARTFDAARRVAGQPGANATARRWALELLGSREAPTEDLAVLCDAAATRDDETRAVAIDALRRQASPAVADLLIAGRGKWRLDAWAPLMDLLIGRDEWALKLLEAVKKGAVRPTEISLANRDRLMRSDDRRVWSLAGEVLPVRADGNRAAVVARYKTVATLRGDATRGATFFARDCAACHALGNVGHPVGPDLSTLRDKDPDYFVKNILDPSAVVEPRFVYYQVITKDRRVLAGVLKSETPASLTLQSGNRVTETVARADVREVRPTNASMMPEGFEASYSPQDLADLVAFVRAGPARGPRRAGPENGPVVVAQSKDRSLVLPANKAEIFGERAVLEPEFQNVGYWSGFSDEVVWTVRVDDPGEFDVYADYACSQSAGAGRFSLSSGGGTVQGEVRPTGPDWSRYVQARVARVTLQPGRQEISIRPFDPPREALMDLRALALVPVGAKPKWPGAPGPEQLRAAGGNDVARDPPSVARVILNKALPNDAREAAVAANPQFAAELVAEMTRDLAPGTPAEYERIPWVWRVAVACGRRDDAAQLRRLLAVALPRDGQPLLDWQAVVLGGGVVMGASDRGHWPAARVAELLADDADLQARWRRAVDLAAAMADDAKVPTPTRYDALRMLAVRPWAECGPRLSRYLAKGTNEELQAGAISAAGDVDAPGATEALLKALPHLAGNNRNLALDALLRNRRRAEALARAIESGAADRAWLDGARSSKLNELRNGR
jgi:putative membrane-bound dehydrogenase-like protein